MRRLGDSPDKPRVSRLGHTVLACLLASLAGTGAEAQTGAQQLPLAQAVDRALAANGLLEASRERVAVAAGLRQQALIGPNPRLILQTENLRPNEFRYFRDTDDFAFLQHTLETGGRRLKRGALAGAVETRFDEERQVLAAEIRGRVKRAYWAAAGTQEAARWLEANLMRFAEIVSYHEIRLREGAIAEADLLRVRLEESKLRLALSNARLSADRARIELQREMSQTEFPAVELEPIEGPMPPVPGTPAEALMQRPEVRAAEALVRQAESNLNLQTAVAKPNVDAVLGFKRVAGGPGNTSYSTMIAGLQMDLPLFNKNQGNVAASQADIRVARAALAAVKARIVADVEAAQRSLQIRTNELANIIAPLRAQAEEGASIAQAAYRIGGVDLLRLIDSERARIEAQLTYFQSLTDYRQSAAALEVALGLP